MIVLKPTLRYWLMTNFVWIVIISLLYLIISFWELNFILRMVLGGLSLVLIVGVFWNCLVLYNITYIIEKEQIIIKYGVFFRVTDYLEMYRIYDYKKQRNIFEVVFGLMNVVLVTRDSGHPQVVFKGISNNDDVIPVIRDRVETEKQKKRIIEFNNPMI
jgi:membrane protein YdbS with pleckstrin-like domain